MISHPDPLKLGSLRDAISIEKTEEGNPIPYRYSVIPGSISDYQQELVQFFNLKELGSRCSHEGFGDTMAYLLVNYLTDESSIIERRDALMELEKKESKRKELKLKPHLDSLLQSMYKLRSLRDEDHSQESVNVQVSWKKDLMKSYDQAMKDFQIVFSSTDKPQLQSLEGYVDTLKNSKYVQDSKNFFVMWDCGQGNSRRKFKSWGNSIQDTLFEKMYEDLDNFLSLTLDLEFYRAALKYETTMKKHKLSLRRPSFLDNGSSEEILNMFDPLPVLTQGKKPIPQTYNPEGKLMTFVTGTEKNDQAYFIRARGLVSLLSQSGLRPPCDLASIPVIDTLYVQLDLPNGRQDEYTTYKEGLERILASKPGSDSLVLINQLADTRKVVGVDIPLSGALKALSGMEAEVVVTTHYSTPENARKEMKEMRNRYDFETFKARLETFEAGKVHYHDMNEGIQRQVAEPIQLGQLAYVPNPHPIDK